MKKYRPVIIGFVLATSLVMSVAFVSSSRKTQSVLASSSLTNGGYAEGEYHYYDGNYYDSIGDSAISTGGTTLLSALCSKIQPSSGFGYSNLYTIYPKSDVYPSGYDGTDPLTGNPYPTTKTPSTYVGKIWDMYSDCQYSTSSHNGNYSNVGDMFNREHTVPQSWFGESQPAKSDPHHVLPTDGKVNGQRSNLHYGEIASGEEHLTGGFGSKGNPVSTYGSAPDSKIFEPEDAYKGDLARGVLYVAAAYYEWGTSLAQGNSSFKRSGNHNLLSQYYINLLSKWNADDPVSQKEIDRNNAIYNSTQKNRNPFIDHPTWVYKIWGGTPYTWNNSTNPRVNAVSVSPSALSLNLDTNPTGNLTATVSVANGAATTVTWTSSNENVATVNAGVVTAVGQGSATITATSTFDNTKSGTCAVTVTASGQGGGGGGDTPDPDGNFSETYDTSNHESSWNVSNSSSQTGYRLCPSSGTTSVVTIPGIFTDRTVASSITVTINNATYGNGDNPTSNTFKFYSDIGCTSQVTAAQSGSLPTKSTYVNTIYTITAENAAGFSDDLVILITKPGKQIRLQSITVEFSYGNSGGSSEPTLSSISLDTTNVNKVFTVGDTFSYSGLVVTANYSDSTSEVVESGYTVSSPDMSTSGNKTITVSYGGKSASYQITVNTASASSITATVGEKTYYVGETISKSDITVKDNLNNVITDFTFANDGYKFTYADAASGGNLTDKVFADSISYGNLSCSLTAKVQRKARTNSLSQDLEVTYTDLPTAYSTTLTERTAASGVKFYAYNCANYSGKMQFKSSVGYFETSRAMTLKSLTIHNRESNTLTVYGSNTAGSFSKTITGTNDVYDLEGYTFVQVKRASSGAAYCSKITISVAGGDSAVNLANYIMYEDTEGQCNTKFTTAKGYFDGLTTSERNTFMTSEDYVISSARERFEAWAKALNKEITYVNDDYVVSTKAPLQVSLQVSFTIMIVVIVSLLGLGVGGYFLIKRKRQQE